MFALNLNIIKVGVLKQIIICFQQVLLVFISTGLGIRNQLIFILIENKFRLPFGRLHTGDII